MEQINNNYAPAAIWIVMVKEVQRRAGGLMTLARERARKGMEWQRSQPKIQKRRR